MREGVWFAGACALGIVGAACGGNTSGEATALNACGGAEPLRYQDAAAAPTDPCGPCQDGVVICASPNALVCVGASAAEACFDASDSGTSRDATLTDASDTAAPDGSLEDSASTDASEDVTAADVAAKDVAALDVATGDVTAEVDAADGGADDAVAIDAADAGVLGFAVAEGGAGWQSAIDASIPVTTSSDGGLPTAQCLALATSDLVFDPVRTLLYASVASTSPSFGNSVVRIDPSAVAVTGTVFAGSNPGALDLSDDASSLYVGLDGASSVMRIDPATGQYDAPVYLGAEQFEGPRTAGLIRAVPGSSSQYVVSRRVASLSPSFAGLALYDGAALLGEWNGFTGGETIAFTSPSVLFGYNNEDTGFDLFEFEVTSAGFQQLADTNDLVSGFYVTITAQGGWIFATSGQVVDSATNQPAGQYPASGPVWPSPDGANVWFLTSGPTLVDFDRTTFLPTRSVPLAAGAGGGTPASLIGLSPASFAYRTPTSVCIVAIAP